MSAHPFLAVVAKQGPLDVLADAHIAFQPIISTGSLRTHGFEALARFDEAADAHSVHALMDAAAASGELRLAERILLTKSITSFAEFSGARAARLFCNVDNRVFDDPRTRPEHIVELARERGLEPANLCIELSERQAPQSIDALRRLVALFLSFNVRIAIDDFGRGFSGLDMLMQVNPHYIKVDRAFIQDVGSDARKQAIVHKVAGLAHSLGLLVVAEGVETESEFRTARELGCDLAQGYLIGRPTAHLAELRMDYGHIGLTTVESSIPSAISELLEVIEPLKTSDSIADATERFKTRAVKGMLPVVDDHGYVHGAIYESDIGNYLFGDYGSALLANKGMDQSVHRVLRRCPISEATVTPETLVESYVVSAGNEGVVLTVQGRYAGLLTNNAILRLAAAREVAAARDQNPLTQLPGNNSINRHIEDILAGSGERTLAFFDFDNFKAFNDKYGFATGDRALLVFADLLRKLHYEHEAFIGHIGGDDFVLSVAGSRDAGERVINAICQRFRQDVASLYSNEDRVRGGIFSDDRFGEHRFFPLLRASAVTLHLSDGETKPSQSDVVSLLAASKSLAKKSAGGVINVATGPSAAGTQ